MKAVSHIDSSSVVAIDIETVRLVNKFDELSDDWKEAWAYKNKHEGKVPDYEELEKLWFEAAPLYPEFSKVVTVSLAYMKGNELRCKQYTSDHEFLLLKQLANDLVNFSKFRLIGHASKFFDFPFLAKRYIINNMEIPSILDESNKKPWEQSLLCTNELWKSFGTGGYGSSLFALSLALGLEVSKVDLVGDEVGKAYYNGELSRIADYCSLDTIATFNVFRRFKGESTFKFDDVVYVNKGEVITLDTNVKEVNIPILTKIFDNGTITDSDIKKLTEASSTLDKSEKANLAIIIRACLKDKLSDNAKAFIKELTK
jgi:3'-5' exonuclease